MIDLLLPSRLAVLRASRAKTVTVDRCDLIALIELTRTAEDALQDAENQGRGFVRRRAGEALNAICLARGGVVDS